VTTNLWITTAVTCPTVRIHPAIIAQAAATAAVMMTASGHLVCSSSRALAAAHDVAVAAPAEDVSGAGTSIGALEAGSAPPSPATRSTPRRRVQPCSGDRWYWETATAIARQVVG
jgi:hypothetical protein